MLFGEGTVGGWVREEVAVVVGRLGFEGCICLCEINLDRGAFGTEA